MRAYFTSKGQLTKRGQAYQQPRHEYYNITPALLKQAQSHVQAGQTLPDACKNLGLYLVTLRTYIKSNGQLTLQGKDYLTPRHEYNKITPTLLKQAQSHVRTGQTLRDACKNLGLYSVALRTYITPEGELRPKGQAYMCKMETLAEMK